MYYYLLSYNYIIYKSKIYLSLCWNLKKNHHTHTNRVPDVVLNTAVETIHPAVIMATLQIDTKVVLVEAAAAVAAPIIIQVFDDTKYVATE